MRKALFFFALLPLLLPLVVLACPPQWLQGSEAAHSTLTVTLDSAERMAEKEDGYTVLSCQATVSQVFYGDIDKNKTLHFAILSKNEPHFYATGTNYILYLKRYRKDLILGVDPPRWIAYQVEDGIQNDTEERRNTLEKVGKSRENFDKYLAEKEDINALSPAERKMNSIIIPVIEFRCANIHDVIPFLNEMSKEFDGALYRFPESAVIISNTIPRTADVPLIHYYAENASLLKNLKVLELLAGCEYLFTNGVVEIRSKADVNSLPDPPASSQERPPQEADPFRKCP
jgi:hypothetical protein